MSNNKILSSSDLKNTIKTSLVEDWALCDWEQRIMQLPELEATKIKAIEPLLAGTINKTFKVTSDKGTWVVRFNNDDPPGIHRATEAKILELIKPLSIAPELIANKNHSGYLITAFFEGEMWQKQDLSNPKKLRQLKEILAPMHQISFQSRRTELVFRMVEYIHYFTKMNPQLKSDINKAVTELSQLGFWQKQNRLLHFDLNPNNIISNGKETRIIDWEYAGTGHPLIEWCVIQNYAEQHVADAFPQFTDIAYADKVQHLVDLMMQMWEI